MTTARTNQTTGMTKGKAANWAPEVVFSPFRTLSRRQLTFPKSAKSAYCAISFNLTDYPMTGANHINEEQKSGGSVSGHN